MTVQVSVPVLWTDVWTDGLHIYFVFPDLPNGRTTNLILCLLISQNTQSQVSKCETPPALIQEFSTTILATYVT